MSLAAHDRHALPRPVALARGPGRRRRSTSQQAAARVPRRARARVQLPPRRRAGRDLPAQPHGDRRDAEAGARPARARPAAAPSPRARRPVTFFDDRPAASTRRVYVRDDLPAGDALDGPGDRRPARLDDRRAARLAGGGRRVAEHPACTTGGSAMSDHRAAPLHASTRSRSRCSRTPSSPPSTRWRSRSCAPATRS